MPFCPQCGAEYTEGITACHECGVPLVQERPEVVRTRRRRAAPRWLRPLRAGFRYAAEAARVLWRRPGLLWLPLAVACWNTLDAQVWGYIALTQTAEGREAVRVARARERPPVALALRGEDMARAADRAGRAALRRFAEPVPLPGIYGLQSLMVSQHTAGLPPEEAVCYTTAVGYLQPLAELPLGVLFLAGYFGLLWRAASPEQGTTFRRAWRANYWRFLGYLAMVLVVRTALKPLADWAWWLLPARATEFGIYYTYYGPLWTPLVLALPLGLGLVVMMTDGVGVIRGMTRSAGVVVRQLPTALVLLALAFLPLLLLELYSHLLGMHLLRTFGDAALVPLVANGAGMLGQRALLAIIGVWYVLAQLVWYREARVVPAMVAVSADTDPGEATAAAPAASE